MEQTRRPEPLPVGDLQLISDNIPGGMFSCRFDAPLTLIQMNDGFLSMLGYTREDIRTRFHDSFWDMIDPRDRASALEEVLRQTALGPDKELEYRMTCKDGGVIWVLDKGHLVTGGDGSRYFCCVLVDVTRSKELEARLRLSLERLQIIMDQTTDIIFEWDLAADTFEFSPNWEKRFGSPPVTRNVSLYLAHAPHVYPEDQPVFARLLERIRHGERYGEAELRFLRAGGSELWCRVRMTGLAGESGRIVRAVGAIVDIDAEKREAQRLLESARRDALTKLYNKGACKERIEAALAQARPGSRSALLIIDLDNFKQTNDTMGHLFGDALLVEVAQALQKQFRSQDVVARVGGDEFAAFLDQIPGPWLVQEKAEQILRAISELAARELAGAELSCSIGGALSPDCGETYHDLFQKADQALYRAKSLGKNQFCLFDAGETEGFPGLSQSAVGARIDSDESAAPTGSRLVEYVFRILYKSVDLDAAINAILEIVGRQFDVSRAYIFEDDEDSAYCINTFEWCNDGVEPQIQNLQHICYATDLAGGYRSNFNEDNVFYCRDISTLSPQQYGVLAPQGIKSMLQCAIYDGGCYRGFVGFDECRTNRFWTQEQVDALIFISRILSTFLLKQRAQDRAIANAQAMEAILDSQSAWIYTVRPETNELLYINRKTREWVPAAQPGMTCHAAFFHRDTPCVVCPIKGLGAQGGHCTREIYNPLLKVWTSTDACPITWKGEEAVLLTCHDITQLKTELEQLKQN